jgi:hypothetical protein
MRFDWVIAGTRRNQIGVYPLVVTPHQRKPGSVSIDEEPGTLAGLPKVRTGVVGSTPGCR